MRSREKYATFRKWGRSIASLKYFSNWTASYKTSNPRRWIYWWIPLQCNESPPIWIFLEERWLINSQRMNTDWHYSSNVQCSHTEFCLGKGWTPSRVPWQLPAYISVSPCARSLYSYDLQPVPGKLEHSFLRLGFCRPGFVPRTAPRDNWTSFRCRLGPPCESCLSSFHSNQSSCSCLLDETNLSFRLWTRCSLGEVEFWKWLILRGVSVKVCCGSASASSMCFTWISNIITNVDSL